MQPKRKEKKSKGYIWTGFYTITESLNSGWKRKLTTRSNSFYQTLLEGKTWPGLSSAWFQDLSSIVPNEMTLSTHYLLVLFLSEVEPSRTASKDRSWICKCYSALAKGWELSLFFFFFFSSYVANRHAWDADWSQIGNLETVIGRKSALLRRWLVRGLCMSRAGKAQ